MTQTIMNRKAKVRLSHDPKVQNAYIVQVWEDPKWLTLLTFNNEMLARNHFAAIKKYGIGVRVLEEAVVDEYF
ncbi:MAG: hypothetical protein RB191_19895 [Terriglobia bacterium]|nr:hypothetical protein [Terriglobia bacterium]